LSLLDFLASSSPCFWGDFIWDFIFLLFLLIFIFFIFVNISFQALFLLALPTKARILCWDSLHSSLKDFCHKVVGLFLYEDFWNIIVWLVLKFKISYRVIISWMILVSFRGFFWRLYFCMVKYLNLHNFSFALKYFKM